MHVNSASQDGQNDTNVECDPEIVIKSLIPNVDDDDHHDFEQNVPVLSRTRDGLSVLQLFTLMIGNVPANCKMLQIAHCCYIQHCFCC